MRGLFPALVVVLNLLSACNGTVAEQPTPAAPPPGDSGDTGGAPPVAPGPLQTVVPGRLGPIFGETAVCFLARTTRAGLAVDVLGLDTGSVASLPVAGGPALVSSVPSIFLDAGRLVVTAEDPNGNNLVVLNPRTGAVQRTAPIADGAVHAMGSLYLQEEAYGRRGTAFTGLRRVIAGRGTGVNIPMSSTQRGNGATLLPGTWHSTDTVNLMDPITMAVQRSVVLQGFNTWVQDVQEAGPRLFVLDDGRSGWVPAWTQVLSAYRTGSGRYEGGWMLTESYQSFFCTTTP